MNETREIGSELCGRSENRLRLSKVQAALDWVPCQLASASPGKMCATMARKRAPQQKSIRGNLWESMGIYGNLWESMGIYGKPGKNLTMLWESVTAYH